MGSRANLVLVDQQSYRLFYCHWCANRLIRDLFWGPTYAISYVLGQRPTEGWLDDVWAEGGAVIDTQQKVLLIYGGVDYHEYDPRLLHLYRELLGFVWNGWTVRWAYGGIFDMADYVGLSREVVRDKREREPIIFTVLSTNPYKDENAVSSLVLEDGSLRLFAVYEKVAIQSLVTGPALIDRMKTQPFETQLEYTLFPDGGCHVDTLAKTLRYWTTHPHILDQEIAAAWSGWTVIPCHDEYQSHFEQLGNRLVVPNEPPETLVSQIETRLVSNHEPDPVAGVQDTLSSLEKEGHKVSLNPNALYNVPQKVSLALQREIFNAAVASWRDRHSQEL